jgi:O6-methylguanine-DNA--protein-cysteine methyltransferase
MNEQFEQYLQEESEAVRQMVKTKVKAAAQQGMMEAFQELGFSTAPQEAKPPEPETPPEPQGKSQKTMRARSRSRKGRGKKGTGPLELTDTQQEVLSTIQGHIEKHGHSPTYSEIADELDKSGVATIVHAIENKGWIKLDDTKFSRKIEVLHTL